MSHRGRPESSVRDRIHQYACIDAKDLPPIEPSYTDEEFVSAFLQPDGEQSRSGPRIAESTVVWENGYHQPLKLEVTVTQPHFGGLRQWYVCPSCGGRVRKVYSPAPGYEFKCRRCYELVYHSQYDSLRRHRHYRFFKALGLLK